MKTTRMLKMIQKVGNSIVILMMVFSQFGWAVQPVFAAGTEVTTTVITAEILDPTGTISGTINDADGNPLTGVQVRAVSKSDKSEVATTTANGTYTLTGLPLDTDLAVVASDEDPDADDYPGRYYNNVNDLSWAESILLTSDSLDRTDVDINLSTEGAFAEQLTFNFGTGRLLNDIKIRQAIAYGTDRQSILEDAFGPSGETGEILDSLVMPGLWYQAANIVPLTVYDYNPTTAQDILTAADWIERDTDGIRENASGEELALDFITTTAPARFASADLFKTQMANIGILVNVGIYSPDLFWDSDPFISPLAAGNFDIAEFAWVFDDTDTLLGAYNTGDAQNLGGYSNGTLDGYFNAALDAKVAGTPSTFQESALNWQYLFSEDLPALPMFTRISAPAVPTFTVQPDQGWIAGWNWTVGNPMTLIIDDTEIPSAPFLYSDDTQTVADDGSVWFNVEPGFDLQVGQYVTLSDGNITKIHTVSSLTVTTVDPDADTVAGTAEPGSQVEIGWVCDDTGCAIRRITADATTGEWVADFHNPGAGSSPDEQLTFDIRPGTGSEVRAPDIDGDSTTVQWNVPNPNFSVRAQNGDQVEAYDWPLGNTVTLEIDDPGLGEDYTAWRVVSEADWDHNQTYASFDLNRVYDIQPGFVVSLMDGTTTKSTVVTDLAFTNMDIATDIVSGVANPNASVDVWACDNTNCYNRHVTASDPGGEWTANWYLLGTQDDEQTQFDLVGGTWVDSSQSDDDGDSTMYGRIIPNPHIQTNPDNNWVRAYEWPMGASLMMTINGAGDYTATVGNNNEGDPYDTFAQFNVPAGVHAGDLIHIENLAGDITKDYIVTPLDVTGYDVAADTVSGVALPGASVQVCVNIFDGKGCISRWATAGDADENGLGHWTVNFIEDPGERDRRTHDLVLGDNGWASEPNDTGDQTWVNWNIPNPRIQAYPDSNWVYAYDWPDGSLLTLTIGGQATTYEATVQSGSAYFNLMGFDLQAGDIITLEGGGLTRSMTVGALEVDVINAGTRTVSGTAGNGAEVHVWVNGQPEQTVTATGGNWTVIFTSLNPGDNGGAREYDSEGNYTQVDWRVQRPWIQANVNGRWVQAYDWPDGSLLTLTIGGQATTYEATVQSGSAYFNLMGFDLQAGQTLTVTDNGSPAIEISYTLKLEITEIDVDLNTIWGIGEPGTDVQVCAGMGGCIFVTPAAGTGQWTANFSGSVNLVPGSSGSASQTDLNGNRTWVNWNIPNCYTLTTTYTGNGSDVTASPTHSDGCAAGQYIAGATIDLSGAVPNTGWEISGWTGTDDDSSTVVTNTLTMPTGDHEAKVNYSQIEYALTINTVGSGSVTPNNTAPYHLNDVVVLTPDAEDGWSLSAWTGACTGSGTCSVTMDAAKTVTATFVINTYTVSGDLDITGVTVAFIGSTSGSATISGSSYSFTAPYGWTGTITPSKTGYTFSPTSITITTPATDDLPDQDFGATINAFTLIYTAGAHGSITGDSLQTVNYGGSGTEVTAEPDPNYHFVNWSDLSTANPRTDTNVTADIDVTANFAVNNYTISFNSNGGSLVTAITQVYGSTVTAPTDPTKTGNTFAGWYSDAGLTTAYSFTTMPASDITLYAKWTVNNYTLTYTAGANGSITGTTPQTVNYGGSGSLVTATPAAGYHFVSWSDSYPTAARTDLNVTGNISVTATFAINSYTLTYTAGANGSIDGITPQTVNHGGSGTEVTAVADPGFSFVDWSDGVLTASRTDTNVTANVDVTANFAITKANPNVTAWPTASAIIYGQTLASSTFSGGVATPAGSFAFTTPTTAPNAGTASQSVTYTPLDTDNYNPATGTASVTVNRANSNVTTWPIASAITYGQMLSSSTLSGGAATPTGSFAFTTPTTAPNAGTASQSVTFTPNDTDNYNTATGTASVTVNRANSNVTTWPTASAITYGQMLSSSTLSGGAATPTGSFAFTTPTTAPNAGTASQSVTYTPLDTDNYNTAIGTVSVTVNKASSSVTVDCPVSATYTGSAIETCTASYSGVGGLSGSLSPTYSDNVIVGTATANASYAGDANHNGSSGSDTFAITKASSSVTVDCPVSATYTGSAIEICTASYSGVGGLSGSLSPTYSDNVIVGTATANASYAGDANHNGSSGSDTFAITKANSNVTAWPTASAITYGQTLASSTFSGGVATPAGSFAFTTPTTAPNAGTASQSVTYTPTDTDNYNPATGTVSVTANAVNDAPIITEGASISVSMSQDGSTSLTLHATDVDGGDTITWSINTPPGHGTASASGTGTSRAITYTPALHYIGSDSFVVQVSDGNGGTDTITVNVTITAVEPPSFTIFLPLILH